jgi:hypothetical protein
VCDTFVALSNSTKDGSIIFAKNSDREPDEPHIGVYIERKIHHEKTVKCTYIAIEQVPETFACLLFKPSWIWGAEMGVNEHGVVIGNEAVFTNKISKETSLIGMDYLRLALERSKNATEAVNVIIELLERYGQGGKCGYTKNLRYDNSYLIADFKEAYVLETAGKDWALKRVVDVYSISNSLTIRDDYDNSSLKQKLDFKSNFENKIFSKIAAGDFRRKKTLDELIKLKGNIDLETMIRISRIHTSSRNIINGSHKSICMHSWSLISSETTGSFVVKLLNGNIKVLATLSPRPCSSIYKPLNFKNNLLFKENEVESATSYWKKRKKLVSKLSKNSLLKKKFEIQRDELEKEILKMNWTHETISKIWKNEEELVDNFLNV